MNMKKLTQIILLAASLSITMQSCQAQKVVVNREVETESDGKMLLGTQTKSQLSIAPYSDWYNPEHNEYTVDQNAVAELKKEKLSSYNIVLVLGTWCEDSHRQVPRLMKILEAVEHPESKLTIIGVNRKKEAPGGEEGTYNIQNVPTIIVQKYGKELGRIVENPSTGYIERDLLEILIKDNSNIKELLK